MAHSHLPFVPSSCGDFGNSVLDSAISLHSTLPVAVCDSETLGRVINFISEKPLLQGAASPSYCIRLHGASSIRLGRIMARGSVPVPPVASCTMAVPTPADSVLACGCDLPSSCGCFNCSEKSLLKAVLRGGPSVPGLTCRNGFYFQYRFSRWKSLFSLARSPSAE